MRPLRSFLVVGILTLPLLLATLPLGTSQSASSERPWISRVPVFDDVLWTNVNNAQGVAHDASTGEVWYATTGGLVHVSGDYLQRRIFTTREGMPVSYTLGVALTDRHAWAATDAGLVRIDRATFAVEPVKDGPDQLRVSLTAVATHGEELWVGSFGHGGAWLNLTTGVWRTFETPAPENRTAPVSVTGFAFGKGVVWVSTSGSGLLRFDRTTSAWDQYLWEDGLPTTRLLGVAQDPDGTIWIAATEKGLLHHDPAKGKNGAAFTRYTSSEGLPGDRVITVAVHPDRSVWVGTGGGGVGILSRASNTWQYMDPRAGLPSADVRQLVLSATKVIVSTAWGVAVWDGEERSWTYLNSGNGPLSTSLLGAYAEGDVAYWGSVGGVSIFNFTTQRWSVLGPREGLNTQRVYDIKRLGEKLWFAGSDSVWGYAPGKPWDVMYDTSASEPHPFWKLAPDGDHLWLAEFGNGLLRVDPQTKDAKRFSPLNGLLDIFVTDVVPLDSVVWVSGMKGLHKYDKGLGEFVDHLDNVTSGLPTTYVVSIDAESESILWVGTADGGLIRFDTAARVPLAEYTVATAGLPENGVKAFLREPSKNRIWIGTSESGLALLDLATGRATTFNESHGLAENHVNGLLLREGILYASTHGGIARMDTATLRFLPQIFPRDSTMIGITPGNLADATVKITNPPSGAVVSGEVTIQGTATANDASPIDRVEWRAGDGEWQIAQGTERWRFTLDTTVLEPGEHRVQARAWVGDRASPAAGVILSVVRTLPDLLNITHVPPGKASVGTPIVLAATIRGAEPVHAVIHYRHTDDDTEKTMNMTRQGARFEARIPAADARGGSIFYVIEAFDRNGRAISPADETQRHAISIEPPRVSLVGPARVEGRPGDRVSIPLTVTNTGDKPLTVTLRATGSRASWVKLAEESIDLQPRAAVARLAAIEIPPLAFPDDNATLIFQAIAQETSGGAVASVRLAVLPALEGDVEETPIKTPPTTKPSGGTVTEAPVETKPESAWSIPGFGSAAVFSSVLAAALALAASSRLPPWERSAQARGSARLRNGQRQKEKEGERP